MNGLIEYEAGWDLPRFQFGLVAGCLFMVGGVIHQGWAGGMINIPGVGLLATLLG